MQIFTWHIVTSEVGTILSVWGEDLLSEAQAHAKHVEGKTGLPTFLHHIRGERPVVGDSLFKRRKADK